MNYSTTETYTYTDADVEAVARRFTADIVMIAQSTGAITEDEADVGQERLPEEGRRHPLQRIY
jgi:hypothetical protein